jgi:hypothetical protein
MIITNKTIANGEDECSFISKYNGSLMKCKKWSYDKTYYSHTLTEKVKYS